jgi:hypothetical protein
MTNYPKKFIRQTVYVDCRNASTLQDLLDEIPEGFDPKDLYIDLEIETGYYGSESTKLSLYYYCEIKNPTYEEDLKKYENQLKLDKYYKKHCKDYFKKGEKIKLPVNQIYFYDKLEIAPLKKESIVEIYSVLQPQSPDMNSMTNTNWCQVIYFIMDGKNFNTILYSKNVILRLDI